MGDTNEKQTLDYDDNLNNDFDELNCNGLLY
jgi:hypothetical protein